MHKPIRWRSVKYSQAVLLAAMFVLFSLFIGTLPTLAATEQPPASSTASSTAQKEFIEAFEAFCGQAYSAKIIQDSQPSPAWEHPLIVHIRDCEDSVIRMPLHVGEDRSRTWVLTLHEDFIDFQHFHLHEDGSPDAVSPYGGRTLAQGTASSQSFPADKVSKALFIANELDASVNNTWSIDFPDENTMRYRLSRPGRLFEVQVDLSQPIPLPPPAWGYTP